MTHRLWYVKRKDQVRGPFPAKVLSQYYLVGRLREDDLVSIDKKQWEVLASVDELVPEVMKGDLSDPEAKEKLIAARRWADERLNPPPPSEEGETVEGEEAEPQEDRRKGESIETLEQRAARLAAMEGTRTRMPPQWVGMVVIFSVVAVLIWAAMSYKPAPSEAAVDCDAAPAPDINWSNCSKQGLQLMGSNLQGAIMRNTDLSGSSLAGSVLVSSDMAYANFNISDLRQVDMRNSVLTGASFRRSVLAGADLSGADLAYADLWQADLSNVNLEGARLDRAIWTDKTVCAVGSIGRCIPSVNSDGR